MIYMLLHHFPTLDTRHPLYTRYLLQSNAAVRNWQIPPAGQCCSKKKTSYPLRSGYLVFSHTTATKIPAAGFSSVGSWCKPIIQPPTRGILVDRATYFRTNHLWKGDTRAYGLGISFPFVVGPQVYGSVKQDTTRGSVGLLLKSNIRFSFTVEQESFLILEFPHFKRLT